MQNGEGWKARCPAHEDHKPSLVVTEADDGKVLLHCHAQCDFNSIVTALGLKSSELFPPKLNGSPPTKPVKQKRDVVFATFEAGRDWMARKLSAAATGLYIYVDAAGSEVFRVQRFDIATDDKQFKPFRHDPDGWRMKDPQAPLPLYRRDGLTAAPVVWVFEGEKCADLGSLLGLVTTTASHGSDSPQKTDWSPLAGKTVYFVPDNDNAGDGYVDKAAGILAKLNPKPVVKVVRLPLANKGDDIEQWVQAGGTLKQLNELAASAPEWTPTVRPAPSSNGLPEIEITTDRFTAAVESIKALSADPDIFSRGASLGIVIEEESAIAKLSGGVELQNAKGSARFLVLSRSKVGCYLTKNARFYRWQKDRNGNYVSVDIQPPAWLIESVESWSAWPGIRSILTITQCPYVRSDGSIAEPGYDAAFGALFRPAGAAPVVPDRPSKQDASDAKDRLYQLVWQFPFKDGFDFSVWLAALLTAIQRPVITGPVPGFPFTANKAGSGKGLLIDLIGIIAWLNAIPTRSYPMDPAECAKVKLSLALAGVGSVHFDNLPEGGFYGSGELDSALTSTEVSGRILGASKESGSVPLRPVWMLSGNNVAPYKDAYRRWVPCRLNTPLESPHERDDLDVANLRQYAREHRATLLADALTILRAHALGGLPVGWKAPLGSFEEWDRIVRGAVWFATGNDCLETQRKASAEAPDRLEKMALLKGWSGLPDGQTKGHTVKESIELAKDQPIVYATLAAVLGSITTKDGKTTDSVAIGRKFRGMKDQNHGGWILESMGTADGGLIRWRVRNA